MLFDNYAQQETVYAVPLGGCLYKQLVILNNPSLTAAAARLYSMDSDDEYVEPQSGVAQKQDNGYSWEEQYHRSWDVVQEDQTGSLDQIVNTLESSRKRRRLVKGTDSVRRGIIRNVVLILDFSFAMCDTDMRPTRQQVQINYAIEFVTEFFNQNPISQIAIVTMSDGLAHLMSPLGGNPYDHIKVLQGLRKTESKGVPSLVNALQMAQAVLHHVPVHCTKEILLVFGALMSNDPSPIEPVIQDLVKSRFRVRIIGLAAQVAVCTTIAKTTNFGDLSAYNVALNEEHFQQLFMAMTTPLEENSLNARKDSTLVKMGFPKRVTGPASLCACHSKLSKVGYICPQCKVKVCALPTSCPVCSLTLILSTHLARSYHHLFPLAPYEERPPADAVSCSACQLEIKREMNSYKCPNCKNLFCIDCDVYCHETLHNCPGCV